jgi:hypothetical protein
MTDGFAMVSATEPVRGASEPGGIDGDRTCILGDLPLILPPQSEGCAGRILDAQLHTHLSNRDSFRGSPWQLVSAGRCWDGGGWKR